MRYRRAWQPGGTWFFTVNLHDRDETLLVDNVKLLRAIFRTVQLRHPFYIDAIVVLPDHLHAIFTLPTGDSDFSMRWNQIKGRFSKALPQSESLTPSQQRRRERGIWQHRYWEHLIRDERDLENHVNYIHINPVKHGYVQRASEWPHSSIHRYIERGLISEETGPRTFHLPVTVTANVRESSGRVPQVQGLRTLGSTYGAASTTASSFSLDVLAHA